jgi:LacI family transcriptional regulator
VLEAGEQAAERLVARATLDAIVCTNDLLAAGALSVLREVGRRVPEDVAVVGMDNTDLTRVTWPPLTSVDLRSAERARIAAAFLLERIEDPRIEPRAIRIDAQLAVRASSAGPLDAGVER